MWSTWGYVIQWDREILALIYTVNLEAKLRNAIRYTTPGSSRAPMAVVAYRPRPATKIEVTRQDISPGAGIGARAGVEVDQSPHESIDSDGKLNPAAYLLIISRTN